MGMIRKKGLLEANKVLFLPIDSLTPNPRQPRSAFDGGALEELAESIRVHGILQPLSVRRTGGGYELIAGERRLRAARMAGLEEVPCLLVRADDENSSLLALVENLQRRDLDFCEEAAALARLIRTYGLSQEEAARRLGKSQSAVANKLRLLRLPSDVLSLLREHGCTERHARALLRLEGDPEQVRQAAAYVVEQNLTVAMTESYVESLLAGPPSRLKPLRRPTFVIKDVRLFLNSVNKGLTMMKSAGVDAACDRQETADSILLTIRIPKQVPQPSAAQSQ